MLEHDDEAGLLARLVHDVGHAVVEGIEVLAEGRGQRVLLGDQVEHVLLVGGSRQVGVEEMMAELLGCLLQVLDRESPYRLNDVAANITKWLVHPHVSFQFSVVDDSAVHCASLNKPSAVTGGVITGFRPSDGDVAARHPFGAGLAATPRFNAVYFNRAVVSPCPAWRGSSACANRTTGPGPDIQGCQDGFSDIQPLSRQA